MQYQKIWDKILSEDEKVEYEFSIGRQYREFCFIVGLFIGGIVIAPTYFFDPRVMVGLLIILVFLLWFVYGFYLKIANAYAFTNKRVVAHRGWLSTYTISVDYEDITDISVDEPFLNWLLTNAGHLIINSAGTHEHEVILKNIDSPYEAKKRLEEARHKMIEQNR